MSGEKQSTVGKNTSQPTLKPIEKEAVEAVVALVEKKFQFVQKVAADLEVEKVFALNLDRRLQKLESDE